MAPASASVTVRGDAERSRVHRARPAGPLRLLCPQRPGRAAWIVAGNLGGGLVDGDDLSLDVTVDSGAICVVTTQASTKVYRGQTRQRTSVRVAAGGAAIVAPDPVVPFRGARFSQRTEVALAAGASLVLVDTLTAGRVAHGERWSAARIDSALTIAVAGVPRLIDRVVLEDANDAGAGIGPGDGIDAGAGIRAGTVDAGAGIGAGERGSASWVSVAARMRRFDAIATCVLLGPAVAAYAAQQLAALTRPGPRAPIVVVGSPLADGAVFRVAGERVEAVTAAVRALMGDACAALGAVPWQRRW